MRNLGPLPFNDDLSQVLFEIIDPEVETVGEQIKAEDWDAEGDENEYVHDLIVLVLNFVKLVHLVLDTDDPSSWNEEQRSNNKLCERNQHVKGILNSHQVVVEALEDWRSVLEAQSYRQHWNLDQVYYRD